MAYMGSNQFVMGSKVTYVDFTLFELCDLMNWISEGKLFEQNPSLNQLHESMLALPRLGEFYADDSRCMKSPFNNKIAKLNNL